MATDLSADPFGEARRPRGLRRMHLLGGHFTFDSNSAALLDLVDAAFAGLPRHRLPGRTLSFTVSLRLIPRADGARPAPLSMVGGGGYLGGAAFRSNCVVLSPSAHSALILISEDMLRFPYVIRYEYLEFAVYTLASRAQDLLALHGACIGRRGHGVLAIGDSGAGKSTMALHALLAGYEVLAEDAVFVSPSLLATGLPNFLHVRAASLRFVGQPGIVRMIRSSPTIRRRSGVVKFELDLREGEFARARGALALRAVLFLSARRAARGAPLLAALTPAVALQRFMRMQPYAAQQAAWPRLRRRLRGLPCFELRRGAHPDDSLQALGDLLPAR